MKVRNTISLRTKALIYFASMLVFAFIIVVVISLHYSRIQRDNDKLTKVYLTSLIDLSKLKLYVTQSNALLRQWLFIDRDTASQSYHQLRTIHKKLFYKYKNSAWDIFNQFNLDIYNSYTNTTDDIDTLFRKQEIILAIFEKPRNFQNVTLLFKIYSQLMPGGELYNLEEDILTNIQLIYSKINSQFENYISSLNTKIKTYQRNLILWSIIFLIILAILSYIYSNRLKINTQLTIHQLRDLSEGRFPISAKIKAKDEFGIIQYYINQLTNGLRRASDFAMSMAENKFDVEFKPLSRDDILGNALLQLRDNLIKAQHEAELRRIENIQRQWASQGIAEFAELLRVTSNDLEELAKKVIAKLVDYTIANIGGIYIVNDEDPNNIIIELKAFYAYDRHKFLKRTYKPGETLIGQCYLEGETIYMDDIPENYITITSGLGKDKPRSLLIVPLKVNEQILGIVELASFEKFEQYQIEFVEKIGESIASAISTVKINIRTAKLLKETAEKTKRLERQEALARQQIARAESALKELRKNLERERAQLRKIMNERNKLEAEIKRLKSEYEAKLKEKQLEYDYILMSINNALGFFILSPSGAFVDANTNYLKLLNTTKEQIIGTNHQHFVSREFITSGNYKKIWDSLKIGKPIDVTMQYLIEGKVKLVSEVYTPVLDQNNELKKVLVLSFTR